MAKHILAFDDDLDILALYDIILGEAGYKLSASTYSPNDVEYIRQVQPDLVIMDLLFKGEALGAEAARQLANDRELSHLPIILCSGAPTDLAHAHASLASSLKVAPVTKPFDNHHFLKVVDKLLQTS